MRRTSSLASSALCRALLPAHSQAAAVQHRLPQASLYGTASTAGARNSSARRWWFSAALASVSGSYVRVASLGGAGALVTVAGARSLFQEAYAKERPPPELVPKEVVLYQLEACHHCHKVKAFLDYYDIPYKVVDVDPISGKEIKWSDYKKLPILMVDGEQLVDSSDIINKLGNKIIPAKSLGSEPDDDEEKKWHRWVDNHLVRLFGLNMYRNFSETLEGLDYITRDANISFTRRLSLKYLGVVVAYFDYRYKKMKYNIPDERAVLYEAAETWVDALNGRDFLGGSKPNSADLAVFGVLRSIRPLRSFRDMVEHTRIGKWYTRMEAAVGESSRMKV